MQNDLISRSAFIEFIRNLPKTENGYSREYDESEIIYYINEQPTAYDVEKVVQCIHEYFVQKIDNCEEDIVQQEILEYNKVICEIVRSGGMEKMAKSDLLNFLKDINFMYNDCGMHDCVSKMLDDFEAEIRASVIDEALKALSIFNDREHGNEHFIYGIETAKEILVKLKERE